MKKALIALMIGILFGAVTSRHFLYSGDLKDQLVHHLDKSVQAGEILSIIEELSSPKYGGRFKIR